MEERIVREKECRERTGLSKSTRDRMIQRNEFPKKRKLSPKISGWLESELVEWLTTRE